MENPAQFHFVDPVLSGLVAGIQAPARLIGRKSMTRVQVSSQAYRGQIAKEAQRLFEGGGTQGIESEPGTGFAKLRIFDPDDPATYRCRRYGLRTQDGIPAENLARSQFPVDLKMRQLAALKRAIDLQEEARIAALLFAAGSWTSNSTCAALPAGTGIKWSAPGSHPLYDLGIMRAIYEDANSGLGIDTFRIGKEVFRDLQAHDDLIGFNLLKAAGVSTGNRYITDAEVIEVLSVVLGCPRERIFVGEAMLDTSNPGQAAATRTRVWTDNVLISHELADQPPMADGDQIYASAVAVMGIDEVGALAGAPIDAGMMGNLFASQWIKGEDSMVWHGSVWQYATEVSVLPACGYLLTDCH